VGGDWQLALASYNCGPARVMAAIQAAGGQKDFWAIYHLLPYETRAYVPKFIAFCYIMNHALEHNIFVEDVLPAIPSDSLVVHQNVGLAQFAHQNDFAVKDLEMLNPHLLRQVIPGAYRNGYTIRVPRKQPIVTVVDERRKLNYQAKPAKYAHNQDKTKVVYKVKEGDNIEEIAVRFGVQLVNVKLWNRLTSENLTAGQVLHLWIEDNKISPKNESLTLN
jgi:membrane-bound lytic murein transglycosylase D